MVIPTEQTPQSSRTPEFKTFELQLPSNSRRTGLPHYQDGGIAPDQCVHPCRCCVARSRALNMGTEAYPASGVAGFHSRYTVCGPNSPTLRTPPHFPRGYFQTSTRIGTRPRLRPHIVPSALSFPSRAREDMGQAGGRATNIHALPSRHIPIALRSWGRGGAYHLSARQVRRRFRGMDLFQGHKGQEIRYPVCGQRPNPTSW
jgi:hypothetical protein